MTSSFTEQQKEELKQMMFEVIDSYFRNKGQMGKHWLITAATIIGAVTVILGGFKAILGWLGFQHIINQ
jgi:hypothetical protein